MLIGTCLSEPTNSVSTKLNLLTNASGSSKKYTQMCTQVVASCQVLWNFTVNAECKSLQCFQRYCLIYWHPCSVEINFQVPHNGSSIGLNHISVILIFSLFKYQ